MFSECGADIVIGTHPHVIEPMEKIEDDKGHEMPVYYSLGNFVNATSGSGKGVMNRMVGGMAEITIEPVKKGNGYNIDAEIKPVICHLTEDEATAYFLEDYTEELAGDNIIRRQDPDFSLKNCRELVRRVWGNV
ncbi:MAG: CapA family protein [Lachnospiraceae bacterium]|nr:CapA family protein [Lachnospiraceae bacterium]